MRYDLIFFDRTCSFCRSWVARIAHLDKRKRFRFAPLDSKRAHKMIPDLINANTLVLLEQGRGAWIRGKAVFRILYLIGGPWKLLGWMHHLPAFLLDPIYRLVACFRHHLHMPSSDQYLND